MQSEDSLEAELKSALSKTNANNLSANNKSHSSKDMRDMTLAELLNENPGLQLPAFVTHDQMRTMYTLRQFPGLLVVFQPEMSVNELTRSWAFIHHNPIICSPLIYAIHFSYKYQDLARALIRTSNRPNGCRINQSTGSEETLRVDNPGLSENEIIDLLQQKSMTALEACLFNLGTCDEIDEINSELARSLILRGFNLAQKHVFFARHPVPILDQLSDGNLSVPGLSALLNSESPIISIPQSLKKTHRVIFASIFFQSEPLFICNAIVNTRDDLSSASKETLDTSSINKQSILQDILSFKSPFCIVRSYLGYPMHCFSNKVRSYQFLNNVMRLGELCYREDIDNQEKSFSSKASPLSFSSSASSSSAPSSRSSPTAVSVPANEKTALNSSSASSSSSYSPSCSPFATATISTKAIIFSTDGMTVANISTLIPTLIVNSNLRSRCSLNQNATMELTTKKTTKTKRYCNIQ